MGVYVLTLVNINHTPSYSTCNKYSVFPILCTLSIQIDLASLALLVFVVALKLYIYNLLRSMVRFCSNCRTKKTYSKFDVMLKGQVMNVMLTGQVMKVDVPIITEIVSHRSQPHLHSKTLINWSNVKTLTLNHNLVCSLMFNNI